MRTLLLLDSREFRARFNRRPFRVRHELCSDALFELPRIAELAASLPATSVEYNAGDVPVDLDPSATPGNGLSPAETVRRIEHCRSWMVLKNVEQDADYRHLLERCLAEIRQHSGGRVAGMHLAEAFLFVSSPGSVTPFHIDPEHNFLFQVRGVKTMQVFNPRDREVLQAEDLERFFSGAHRNLRYNESWEGRGQGFELQPGDGLHVPVTAPHWVQNGDEVSISFSVTFRSKASKRVADVWQMNHRLRSLGMDPAPAGSGALKDVLKQATNRGLRFALRLASRGA